MGRIQVVSLERRWLSSVLLQMCVCFSSASVTEVDQRQCDQLCTLPVHLWWDGQDASRLDWQHKAIPGVLRQDGRGYLSECYLHLPQVSLALFEPQKDVDPGSECVSVLFRVSLTGSTEREKSGQFKGELHHFHMDVQSVLMVTVITWSSCDRESWVYWVPWCITCKLLRL